MVSMWTSNREIRNVDFTRAEGAGLLFHNDNMLDTNASITNASFPCTSDTYMFCL